MKILVYILFLSVIGVPSFAVFSSFISVSPSNVEDKKFKINLSTNKEDKNFFDVKIDGITYRDVWLITVDKELSEKEQNEFRNYIWNKEFKPAKILKLQKIYANKSKRKLNPLPPFTIKNEYGSNSYIYMDHPTEVSDGGFYYSIDLPKFYENQIASKIRAAEAEALAKKEAEKEAKKKK